MEFSRNSRRIDSARLQLGTTSARHNAGSSHSTEKQHKTSHCILTRLRHFPSLAGSHFAVLQDSFSASLSPLVLHLCVPTSPREGALLSIIEVQSADFENNPWAWTKEDRGGESERGRRTATQMSAVVVVPQYIECCGNPLA